MNNSAKIILGIIAVAALFLIVMLFMTESEDNKINNNVNTNLTTNTINTNMSEAKTYAFPGKLPDERIVNKKVKMETSKGVIEFELYPEDAPKTVSNFVYLTEEGYYDGVTFHRVEPGFVIQGGDPLGTGTGGPGYKFEDEPITKEYDLGVVAMANAGPDTNGSQFFIMLDNNDTLPKDYTIFGKVTFGIEIVKQIEIGDVMKKVSIEAK
ncbi:MAG: peptidylprolyl isomerase [Candidatus Kerfeldbacteria bacterium]|jgi:peptidyl-prolyl cis-trans isomerase B (cyclophilin B)